MFRRYACHHRVPPFRANRARINAIDQDIATLPFKPSSMALGPFLGGVRGALSEARARLTQPPPSGGRLGLPHAPDLVPQRRRLRIAIELFKQEGQTLDGFQVLVIDL